MSAVAESAAERAEFLPTRESLIEKLKDLENQETWREFFDLYWKLIYGVAVKSGFSHSEAEEVVQDTIIGVSRSIANFKRDPAAGKFKSWLLTITYRRMHDLRRRRVRESQPQISSAPPEEPPNEFEQLWDAEWQDAMKTSALEMLKREVPPKHFQAFFLHVIKEMSSAETARIVGISAGQVYLLKHRLAPTYRKCLKHAETQLDA